MPDHEPSICDLESLDSVERTLLVPLIARALGHRWHLQGALVDTSAEHVLTQLGWHDPHWMPDPMTLGLVLWRTRQFHQWGQDHFVQHPKAMGVNLGAGLSDYFQWLSTGTNRWLDADLACVMRVRERCVPKHPGAVVAALDLCADNWWEAMDNLVRSCHQPLWILLEGVLIYLTPAQVRHLLQTVGDHAPAGSCVSFDVIPQWMTGWPIRGPWPAQQPARFQWGITSIDELKHMHERLHLACVVSWPGTTAEGGGLGAHAWNPWSPYALIQMSVL